VDDHLLTLGTELGTKGVGREHGVACRIVGDGKHVDAGTFGQGAGVTQCPLAGKIADDTAARDQLDGYQESIGVLK
jgi:hypothetical protein